jgi:hypothetical protein
MFRVRELGFVGADSVLFSVYQLFPQTQYLNVEVDVVFIEDFVIFLIILVILVVKFVLVLVRIRTNRVSGFGIRVGFYGVVATGVVLAVADVAGGLFAWLGHGRRVIIEE